MSELEIRGAYETETGEVIVETFRELRLDPLEMPAVLVASHGPFTWGRDAAEAVTNAIALEAVAALAYRTFALSPDMEAISDALLRRHFHRKHGPGAYYGQPSRADDP
jgi:L-ribulose-5-phosphate 4-epimerase